MRSAGGGERDGLLPHRVCPLFRSLRVGAQNIRGWGKSLSDLLEFTTRKCRLGLWAVSETHLLPRDYRLYDGREAERLRDFQFVDFKRRAARINRGERGVSVFMSAKIYQPMLRSRKRTAMSIVCG